MVTRKRVFGGQAVASEFVPAPSIPAPQPPVNVVPSATQSVPYNGVRTFSVLNGNPIQVSDVDTIALTTVVTADHGILAAVAFAGAVITFNGTASVTITGTATAINGALNGMTFTPTNDYAGPGTITVSTSDGVLSDADTINLNVVSPNPPVNVVPISQTTAYNTSKVFSVNTGNPITVSDADTVNLTTVVSCQNGTVTAIAASGATITANGTSSVTIQGTAAAINNALNGLVFAPTSNYSGPAILSVSTTDGSLTDLDNVSITVQDAAAPPPPPPPPPPAPGPSPSPGPAPAPAIPFVAGTNIAGMEWATPVLRYGQAIPNVNYTVARAADLRYLKERGFNKVRLPIQWELLQPVLPGVSVSSTVRAAYGINAAGEFHPKYAAMIDKVLDDAAAVGMTVLLDLHNYCRYQDFIYGTFDGVNPGAGNVVGFTVSGDPTVQPFTSYRAPQGSPLGQGASPVMVRIMSLAAGATLTQAQFNDFWIRAANRWKNHPGFGGYGLMNEPHDMPKPGGVTAWNDPWDVTHQQDYSIWPTFAQSAVNAIRAIDVSKPIYVSGNNYQNPFEWATINPGFPLTGTNLIYEFHLYLDASSAGHSFDWDVSVGLGYSAGEPNTAITLNTGLNRAMQGINWCTSRGLQFCFGEFGMPMERDAQGEVDLRWHEGYRRTIDAIANAGGEIFTWMGGNHWPLHAYPITHTPQWHQNKTMEAAVAGVIKWEGGLNDAVVFMDGPSYGLAGAVLSIDVYARGSVTTPITYTVTSDNGGTLSKTTLTLPAGMNPRDRFTYTTASDRVATLTLTCTGGGQTPPPKKIYSIINPVSLAATQLENAANAIMAKYSAAKWLASDAFTDYEQGVPSPNGGECRAISDSGFMSRPDNPMEMIQWVNTEAPHQGEWDIVTVSQDASNARYLDFGANGNARGLWCKKRYPNNGSAPYNPTPEPNPVNNMPFHLHEQFWMVTGVRTSNPSAGGVIFAANEVTSGNRVELRLSAAKPEAYFEASNSASTTLTGPNAISLNSPNIVSMKSKAGAQRLRLNRAQVATAAATFVTTMFDSMHLGGDYVWYYPIAPVQGGLYLAFVGTGDISDAEIDIVEQYAAQVCASSVVAPAPGPTPPPPPPAGDAAAMIAAKFAEGKVGYWLDTDVYTRFRHEYNDANSTFTSWSGSVGRWLDRSGNGHDWIETVYGDRPPVFQDSGTYVWMYAPGEVENGGAAGGAGVGFYFCLAVDSGTYNDNLLTDVNGANTGVRMYWNSDMSRGEFSVGNGSSRVTAYTPQQNGGPYTAAGKHVFEMWYDPATEMVSARIDKGPTDSAYVAGFIATGLANAVTDWGKTWQVVCFENHCPTQSERDSIATLAGAKAGLTI